MESYKIETIFRCATCMWFQPKEPQPLCALAGRPLIEAAKDNCVYYEEIPLKCGTLPS